MLRHFNCVSKFFIKQWVNTVLECYIDVPLTYHNLLPHIGAHLNILLSKMVRDISILQGNTLEDYVL